MKRISCNEAITPTAITWSFAGNVCRRDKTLVFIVDWNKENGDSVSRLTTINKDPRLLLHTQPTMNFSGMTPGYDAPAIQKTLDEMKNTPGVATFGTDLLDALTLPDNAIAITPWKDPFVCGEYTLCLTQADTLQPLQVMMGNYLFYPLINVTQQQWQSPTVYYAWWMATRKTTENGDTVQLPSWKLVWGGDLASKPSYLINDTPMDDPLFKKVTLTLSSLPGYSVSVYYQWQALYFVLFPLDFPGLNVTANYGNNEELVKKLQEELPERLFTIEELTDQDWQGVETEGGTGD